MGKNGAKSQDDFIELCGWEIRKVKDGLDETQVTSLISELITQRDELNQRTEHLSSLSKLAERTVTEADKLAEEMKVEAIERARSETASLIAEAEVKAQEIENETKRIQLELKNSIQGLLSQLLSELDSLKQQVETLQAESEQKLSQPPETASPVTSQADETPVAFQEPTPAASQIDIGEPVASQEPTPAASQIGAGEPVEKVAEANDQETTPDGDRFDLELEILPPLDIMKIMEIVTYLDSLPEIENTELIPNTERPSIIVSLRQPIDLTSMLRTLPEVANVEENETAGEGKIQISLADKSVAQEAPKG